MMPSRNSFIGRRGQHVVAILSTITLLALAGCGGGGSEVSNGGGSSSGGGGSPPPSGSNTAPTISGSPVTAAVTGRAWTFTPTASDPNGDRITFEIQNRPAWATFDTTTGRLSGTPSTPGSFANILISATDGTGRSSLPTFAINVSAVASGTATVAWTAPTLRSDGSALTNLAGYRIYYGIGPNSFDNVIEVNTVGVTNFVVENLSAGTWYFAVSARDSSGAESGLSTPATKTIS
jgi:hypothetical protein